MNRKLFALLLVLLTASCACGAVSPELAASDPRIAPYIDFTKKNGASLLPGRYMHTKELPQLSGGEKILAPTNFIVEIAPMVILNPQQRTFSVNADLWGADEMASMYMLLDFTGTVPILRTYASDEDGEYESIAEDFAVAVSDGQKHIWCLGSTDTGEIRYMYPLNDTWFPAGWYRGTWKAADGTNYTFSDDGQAKMNGQAIGKFIVSDNRIVITRNNGRKELLCAAPNLDDGSLVITFMNGGEMIAGVFTHPAEPSAPAMPSTPQTSPSSTQQMPTQFPKMPDVKMPEPPRPNIDGVWGAYVNGQQWVVQYQGNQYYGWINGQPSEMGIISFNGNTMTGQNNRGESFSATIQLDGNTLILTFPNGNAIQYQKLQ
ncbi:MAG: hypothetical protein IJT02_07080 [Synergistaceae bacterium]|nr:hypothetical protein [Synergistaceae bacterium]